MSTRHLWIALLALAATGSTVGNQAGACCLTDWLFGRSAPVVVGYPAAYTAGSAPYATGYAPVAVPQVAGDAPVAAPYTANYGAAQPSPTTNGAYQVQRPAYFDNPSVYTGQPVVMAPGNVQSTYRLPVSDSVPLSTTLRGASPTSTNYQSAYPAYQSAYPETADAIVPDTAIPATPMPPAFPVVTQPRRRRCCLTRIFDSFGTGYQTTYYRAPVTYYRPVTAVDPVTGIAVTSQQACTSYEQQIQRTPFRTAAPAQTTIMPGPSAAYPQNPYPATGFPGTNGVGQVGGITSPSDQNVIPIPATGSNLPPSHYQQPSFVPNTAPLTGAPPASGGDMAPIEQPRLESARPPESQNPESKADPATPESYWQLQKAEDSTAISPPRDRTDPSSLKPLSTSVSPSWNRDLRPIQAPDDYQSPFRQRPAEVPAPTPTTQQPLVAPPLPPSKWDETDASTASNLSGSLYREAALIRRSPSPRPAKPATETGWYNPAR